MIGFWTYLACQPAPTGLANGDIASIRVEPTELTWSQPLMNQQSRVCSLCNHGRRY